MKNIFLIDREKEYGRRRTPIPPEPQCKKRRSRDRERNIYAIKKDTAENLHGKREETNIIQPTNIKQYYTTMHPQEDTKELNKL